MSKPVVLTRRAVLEGIARCTGAVMMGATVAGGVQAMTARTDLTGPDGGAVALLKAKLQIIVVGAGAFGAWTAWNLQRKGHQVLLVDAWGPAHARASSGGESRVTRAAYGSDEVYTRMARDALVDWRWLSQRSELPIFHKLGVLFFFPRAAAYVNQTLEVHRRLQLPTHTLERAELQRRFPQIAWDGIEIGLYEPNFGGLMARRAIQTLVTEFVKAGGEYQTVAIEPPPAATSPQGGARLGGLRTSTGSILRGDHYVFACGAWLPKVFPDILGTRIFPTRQEVFFFAPEAGDTRFSPGQLPAWADYNHGDIYYGLPDLEARGVKFTHDKHGPPLDPDVGDRKISTAALADIRAFMARRFPALAKRPLIESRVCQYENSSNGDLLIDRHPAWSNVWLLGAGSGHGFKHSPAVGRYAADLVAGELKAVEPRFSLASKANSQRRAVH